MRFRRSTRSATPATSRYKTLLVLALMRLTLDPYSIPRSLSLRMDPDLPDDKLKVVFPQKLCAYIVGLLSSRGVGGASFGGCSRILNANCLVVSGVIVVPNTVPCACCRRQESRFANENANALEDA